MYGRFTRLIAARTVRGALIVCSAVLPGRNDVAAQAPAAASAPRGRITGRIVDAASGQPLVKVQVTLVGREGGTESDLDGRYTLVSVAPGQHAVRARRLGYQPKQVDGVTVGTSEVAVVNFTLGAASVTLQSVVVQETRTDRAASEASLLAIQQRAASASDGISSEQMRRTPDSNAGEAAARVSGISIVDNKFVVARGLSERYSTTLVNGVEIASPEPAKKIVPLDIFPASLLESIVITKSATPDKPGDFSGGAVEVRTKEFPDNTVRQFSVSQSYNSQTTFKQLQMPGRSGMDYLGFGKGRRSAPALPADGADAFSVERFAEGIRSDWNPALSRARPNLGLGLNLGGQRPSERYALGYILSLTYSASEDYAADRFFQFYSSPDADPNRGFVYQDYHTGVDWGGVANLSLRLGTSAKVSWKNLYTRSAEELYSTADGFNVDRNGDVRSYQFQYIERVLEQTQLAGEHLLTFPRASRLEWKGTVSQSMRDEPDNRQVLYIRDASDRFAVGTNSDVYIRGLTDRNIAAQLDWQTAFRILRHDATFKTGVMRRNKRRAFDASLVSFTLARTNEIPDDLSYLPPERLFTPENIGTYLGLTFPGNIAQPYDADESVTAGYVMLDAHVLPRTRIVGGVRSEDWRIDLFDGGRERYATGDTTKRPTLRRNRDLLWSANATVSLTERMNLRLAAFTSVSRPDTRELSLDEYTDIVGNCATIGNPNLQRSTVLNADARWEWYPRAGEVVSISGFYKDFAQPIIRTVVGRNGCNFSYENAISAQNYGGELDVRQNLTYLPGLLSRLSAAVNLTVVESRVVVSPVFGTFDSDLPLEGQSPFVGNASLAWADDHGLSLSLLYNVFGDRVVRYGFRSTGVNAKQGPNIVERSRATLDAKVQRPVGRALTMSLAARNLTNTSVRFVQKVSTGEVSTGLLNPGLTVQLGVAYAR